MSDLSDIKDSINEIKLVLRDISISLNYLVQHRSKGIEIPSSFRDNTKKLIMESRDKNSVFSEAPQEELESNKSYVQESLYNLYSSVSKDDKDILNVIKNINYDNEIY